MKVFPECCRQKWHNETQFEKETRVGHSVYHRGATNKANVKGEELNCWAKRQWRRKKRQKEGDEQLNRTQIKFFVFWIDWKLKEIQNCNVPIIKCGLSEFPQTYDCAEKCEHTKARHLDTDAHLWRTEKKRTQTRHHTHNDGCPCGEKMVQVLNEKRNNWCFRKDAVHNLIAVI